jgi:hypothetical protein
MGLCSPSESSCSLSVRPASPPGPGRRRPAGDSDGGGPLADLSQWNQHTRLMYRNQLCLTTLIMKDLYRSGRHRPARGPGTGRDCMTAVRRSRCPGQSRSVPGVSRQPASEHPSESRVTVAFRSGCCKRPGPGPLIPVTPAAGPGCSSDSESSQSGSNLKSKPYPQAIGMPRARASRSGLGVGLGAAPQSLRRHAMMLPATRKHRCATAGAMLPSHGRRDCSRRLKA